MFCQPERTVLLSRIARGHKQRAGVGVGVSKRLGKCLLHPRIRREGFAPDDADGCYRPHQFGVERTCGLLPHDLVEHFVKAEVAMWTVFITFPVPSWNTVGGGGVTLPKHRWWFLVPPGAILLLLLVVIIALPIISPKLTPYLEGPEFRAELDKQTSKGLHFDGKFGPISRTGFNTASVGEFHASNGVKAMKTMEASDVSAKFNPRGVFLRRWQLDYIHIKRGQVEIQTYEPKPDPPKQKPWYAIFLPDRVYLRQVICDNADITWRMQDQPGGIFGTKVLITPYGRDFEYRAEERHPCAPAASPPTFP